LKRGVWKIVPASKLRERFYRIASGSSSMSIPP
jgi:hypothetical protein